MIFVNDQKAYVLRYGKTTAWIVNPSATREADFKTGELDLSSYAAFDENGIPDMNNGIIVNDKLFITLQMLGNSFPPTDTAYVAVFDITTDQEIDTGKSGNLLKGIAMQVINPFSDIAYTSDTGLIYVQAIGGYTGSYTGGIETINTVNYATDLLVDDGDNGAHPYGNISALAIHSGTLAYFVGYDSFTDNNLYKFNPFTGEIVQSSIAALQDISIQNIAMDNQGRLWVSDSSNATLYIVDANTDEVIDSVSTSLNPGTVSFRQ